MICEIVTKARGPGHETFLQKYLASIVFFVLCRWNVSANLAAFCHPHLDQNCAVAVARNKFWGNKLFRHVTKSNLDLMPIFVLVFKPTFFLRNWHPGWRRGLVHSYGVILLYRAQLKGFGQVWWILFLLLLTTPAWACLQHSRNLAEAFSPTPVHMDGMMVEGGRMIM